MPMIECPCGRVLTGGSEQEVIAAARRHIAESHPDLAGLTDDDLRGMVREDAPA